MTRVSSHFPANYTYSNLFFFTFNLSLEFNEHLPIHRFTLHYMFSLQKGSEIAILRMSYFSLALYCKSFQATLDDGFSLLYSQYTFESIFKAISLKNAYFIT